MSHPGSPPATGAADTVPQVPRPKQRTPELRDEVLRVALTMLATDGVEGFTTRRVASGASTSVPAVYELFGDKAGLVAADRAEHGVGA